MELRVFEKERIRDEEVESVGHKGAIEWYQRIRQSTSTPKPVSQPDNNARPFLTLELPLARGGASIRRWWRSRVAEGGLGPFSRRETCTVGWAWQDQPANHLIHPLSSKKGPAISSTESVVCARSRWALRMGMNLQEAALLFHVLLCSIRIINLPKACYLWIWCNRKGKWDISHRINVTFPSYISRLVIRLSGINGNHPKRYKSRKCDQSCKKF